MFFFHRISFIFLLCSVLFSCSLQKKRYSGGYHIEHAGAFRSQALFNEPLSASAHTRNYIQNYKENNDPPTKCDSIFLKDGSRSAVTIVDVSDHQVKYKMCDNPDASVIVVLAKDVSLIKFNDGRIKSFVEFGDFARPTTIAGMLGDSCVTIVKKDGARIRARITYLDKEKVNYTLCSDPKTVKKSGTTFISQILTDSGKDLKPEIPNMVNRTTVSDEGDPEYVDPHKFKWKTLYNVFVLVVVGIILVVLIRASFTDS